MLLYNLRVAAEVGRGTGVAHHPPSVIWSQLALGLGGRFWLYAAKSGPVVPSVTAAAPEARSIRLMSPIQDRRDCRRRGLALPRPGA